MTRFVPWLIAIIALLLVALVVRQCRNIGSVNYQTTTVTRGPITQAVTATGTLNPMVNVQVGSQVVGEIESAIFEAAVTQAEGDMASAQGAIELARVNAKRTQEMFARKSSS